MAKYEDYVKKVAGGLEAEIEDAAGQEAARIDDATPQIDWENRYKELEKLNSRQSKTLGEQRKMIDDFIVSPTPAPEPVIAEESRPITIDDLYANPDEAVKKAVESHPAIAEAKKITEKFQSNELERQMGEFTTRHPDFPEIKDEPEFRNWVEDNDTRKDLYVRGNSYDLSAADALLSLYKAEKGITAIRTEDEQRRAIEAASLEDSSAAFVAPTTQYSRSEYIAKKMAANQGNLEAEAWVNANSAPYRIALGNGQVRD
jgi:hypothetical protein